MRYQHLLQHRLLVVLKIYEQDMFIVFYRLFKTGKVIVGSLDAKQSTLPRTKTKYQYGEKNKRYPADGGLRPSGKIGDSKNQY